MGHKKHLHIHAIPDIFELEDMVAFCKSFEHLYILGAAEDQEYLLKYFDNCGIEIDGYTVTNPLDQCLTYYRKIPILSVDEVIKQKQTGIIFAISHRHLNFFISKFRKIGFMNYFVMSEHNVQAIVSKVMPRDNSDFDFEVCIVEHCNLSCQCCDHFSQLADQKFHPYEMINNDLGRLAELLGNNGRMIITGGEPLLHNELSKILCSARKHFPMSNIILLTNALLLIHTEKTEIREMWETIKETRTSLLVTVYPIKFDYLKLEEIATSYGVKAELTANIIDEASRNETKISNIYPFNLSTKAIEKFYYIGCGYHNNCNVLKNGKLYLCPRTAHLEHFNKSFNFSKG